MGRWILGLDVGGKEMDLPELPSQAGEGNRTLVSSLEGYSFTIKLHPRLAVQIAVATAPCQMLFRHLLTWANTTRNLLMFRIAFFFLLAITTPLRADLTLIQKVDAAGRTGEMTMKFKGDKIRIDPAPELSMITDSKTGDTVT